MEIAGTILSIVLAMLLLSTGAGKLVGLASSHRIRDSLAVSALAWRSIGVLELLIVAGLVAGIWIQPVGLIAALGVAFLMMGAIITRVRAGGEQRNSGVVADAVVLVVAIATVVTGSIA